MRPLLALAALASLLTGCGAQELVDADDVAARTRAASARIQMRMEVVAPAGTLSAQERENLALLTFRARGVVAERGRLLRLSYVYPARTFGLERRGDVTFDAILDSQRGAVYVKYGTELGLDLPEGKTWVRVRAAELQGLARSTDPSQMVAYLHAAGELERLGEERVRGVATVKYAATIDLERAVEELGGGPTARLGASLDALRDAGVTEVPMTVWIDDESYVRRVHMNWRLPTATAAPAGATLKLALELWDFGAPVRVRLPSRSTIVEQEELTG